MTTQHVTPPASTDPREVRRRGMRSLRMATAVVGTAAVVGTGGIALAVAEQPSAASEVGTGTPPTETGLTAPGQPPEPAGPGPVDASSGAS